MVDEYISADEARKNFFYSPKTGRIYKKLKHYSRECKSVNRYGYVSVCIFGKKRAAHRLAWLLFYGQFPNGEIDHINGDRADNRIANLRDVSRTANSQNLRSKTQQNKSSNFLGVSKSGNKYRAQIHISGRQVYLGTFETEERAHSVYVQAKRNLHNGCTI